MTTYRCIIMPSDGGPAVTATSDAVSPQQAALFLAGERDLPTGTIVRVATANGERVFAITARPSVTYEASDRTAYGHAAEGNEVLT